METKTCSSCRAEQPVTEFYKRSRDNGYQTYCKACARAKRTKWAQDNPGKVSNNRTKSRYGLTTEDVRQMLVAQGNLCAVCDKDISVKYVIDHNHTTGEVRSLLCSRCNTFIGWLETHGAVEKALTYISHSVE